MHHLLNPDIRKKIISTNLQKYGSTNPGSNSKVESKRIKTNISRYGVPNPMKDPDIVKKSLLGRFHISRCIFPENTKRNAIKDWNRYYLGFDEDNPTYIRFIGDIKVFPWESYEKVQDMLSPRVDIDVKDCTMLMVYKKVARQFLQRYDVYGWDNRIELCIGLAYQDKLIQLMTIGKAKDYQHTYQIYRLCTRPGYQVIDGAKKMFNHATQDFEVDDIIAYHDCRFPCEFDKLGMQKLPWIDAQKIWYHHDLMIPDDQLFDKDMRKMFPSADYVSKSDFMIYYGWKYVKSETFDVFEYRNIN